MDDRSKSSRSSAIDSASTRCRPAGAFDSTPEAPIESLTDLARHVLQVSQAAVCLQSAEGEFTVPGDSLCRYISASGDTLVIADTREHPLGRTSTELRDKRMIAFLGAPLISSDGGTLGSFYVADTEPRVWSDYDTQAFSKIAAAMTQLLVLQATVSGPERGRADPSSSAHQSPSSGFTSEEHLRLVLSAVHAGVWEEDLVSGRSFWSREMYELYGCDPEAKPVSGSAFVDRFIHPDDRPGAHALLAQVLSPRQGASCVDIEFRGLRADGAMFWVNTLGHVHRDDTGQPLFALGISRDITKRKLIEQAREESAEFIRRVAAVTPDIIYVFDHEQQRRIYGNRSIEDLLGYPPMSTSEQVALTRSLLHPEDLEAAAAYRRSLDDLPDGVVAESQCRYRHADGSWRWFLTRSAVFARKPDGSMRQIVAASVDITEQKQAEAALRRLNAELEQRVADRTAQLAAANAELEAFVHSAAHDLRAPVRAIEGFSNLLMASVGEELKPEARHYLTRIVSAEERLRELIDALLALTRATHGALAPHRVDLSALAHAIAVELQRSDSAREVRFVISDAIGATADAALVRVVLENLFENAWKFTRGREHAVIEFGVTSDERGRIYFVRDNGIGFDMKHAEQVFAPFRRVHNAEQFPGTGIGLATVARIIARHGGRVWAESSVNHGATFFFTLGGD